MNDDTITRRRAVLRRSGADQAQADHAAHSHASHLRGLRAVAESYGLTVVELDDEIHFDGPPEALRRMLDAVTALLAAPR